MPSDTIAQVFNQLVSPAHKVERGSIGITFSAETSPAVTRMYGGGKGIIVQDVTSGGPAAQGGIKARRRHHLRRRQDRHHRR